MDWEEALNQLVTASIPVGLSLGALVLGWWIKKKDINDYQAKRDEQEARIRLLTDVLSLYGKLPIPSLDIQERLIRVRSHPGEGNLPTEVSDRIHLLNRRIAIDTRTIRGSFHIIEAMIIAIMDVNTELEEAISQVQVALDGYTDYIRKLLDDVSAPNLEESEELQKLENTAVLALKRLLLHITGASRDK